MILQALIFFLVITITAPLLGKYIAFIYRYGDKQQENLKHQKNKWRGQSRQDYFKSLMCFNIICIIGTFLIIYYQDTFTSLTLLPGNTIHKNISFSSALNAAVSFTTGTFWQSHDPEKELNMSAHIFALTAQNFLSSSTSIAVFIAFVRGIINSQNPYIGNFYDDTLRALIFILFPISLIIAFMLIYWGTPHSLIGHITFTNLDGIEEQLYVGPIAGQVAIKNFAANGGSFFMSASGHPFEAPSREAMLFNLILVITLPLAMIFAYGFLLSSIRLSLALYVTVLLVMVTSLFIINLGETSYGLPYILGNNESTDNFNYLGKELIYDKFPSLMWILSVTMGSAGSANACLENYSPLSALVLLFNLIISKFVIEGVGSGFFAMLSYLMVAIFLSGLVKVETANFFGKRITLNEINYVIIVFLITPVVVLFFTAITFLVAPHYDLIEHHGSQAVTDITYNFLSCFASNGTSFNGIDITKDYFNYMTALAMFIGRYPIIYFSLAISGSLSVKTKLSNGVAKHTQSSIELSLFLLITVILVGAIMFLPLMILGPLLEFITM